MANQYEESKPRVLSIIATNEVEEEVAVNGQTIKKPTKFQVNQEVIDTGFRLNGVLAAQQLNQILHELSVNISALWSRMDCGGQSNKNARKNSSGEYPAITGKGVLKLSTFDNASQLPNSNSVGTGCVALIDIPSGEKYIAISTTTGWRKITTQAI